MTDNTVMKIETDSHTLPADPMISMIERIAMDPNSDLSKLEKMLEMKERLEDRDARRAFDRAMAEAKAAMPPIVKTGTVDYENSKGDRTYFKHETLDGIAKIVDPILSQHGLSYRYRSHQDGGQLFVTCVVAHRDGYSEETTLQGSPDSGAGKNNYQAVGSAATYLQRYTLKLALGLSAAKDTDSVPPNPNGSPITEAQYMTLRELIEATGTDEDKFLMAYGIKGDGALLAEFPSKFFEKAKDQLARKKAQMGAQ